jgi:SpoVK/Ycf46/Vps4 family AAA+-type ATPase
MKALTRHSRAGGNPAKKTTRVADKARKLACCAGFFDELDSRLIVNDEGAHDARGIPHAA